MQEHRTVQTKPDGWGITWPPTGSFTWPRSEGIVEVLDHKRVPLNRDERAKRPGIVPYYGATGQVGTIDTHLFDEELVLLGEDGVAFFDPFKPKAYVIDGPSWVNNHAHVLRPKQSLMRAAYLKHALDHADYRTLVGGTTRLKLNKSAMLKLNVPLPGLREQDEILAEIAAITGGCLELGGGLRSGRDRSNVLRKAVLRQAFSGTLRWEAVLAGASEPTAG